MLFRGSISLQIHQDKKNMKNWKLLINDKINTQKYKTKLKKKKQWLYLSYRTMHQDIVQDAMAFKVIKWDPNYSQASYWSTIPPKK